MRTWWLGLVVAPGGLASGCGSEKGLVGQIEPGPQDSAQEPPVCEWRTDVFEQTVHTEIDVLFVIDNSASMGPHQSGLAGNFDAFYRQLVSGGTEWRIGAISTDMRDRDHQGRLRQTGEGWRWIHPESSEPHLQFTDMVLMGTSGSTVEQGLDAIHACLEDHDHVGGHNAGFVRADAALHTIVVSDESAQSKTMPVDEFIPWYDELKPDKSLRTFSHVSHGGGEYGLVTEAIGGRQLDISWGWGLALELLGKLALGVQRDFLLSREPDYRTELEVRITPVDGPPYEVEGARLFGSVVRLPSFPPPGSRIEITYQRPCF